MLQSNNCKAGCELKISAIDAGSLVMKYFGGKWDYGDYKGEEEKEFLHEVAEGVNLLKEMNTSGPYGAGWRGKVPNLQNNEKGKKILIGASDKRDAYKQDIEKFGGQSEINIVVPAKSICDYYIIKKCSYINVGSHGFYTLNNKDTLGLQKKLKLMKHPIIPDFAHSASCLLRVRVQYKGGGDYQFVMALRFGGVKKSPYNIAPLKSGSSSTVDSVKLNSDPILLAFN